MKKQKFISLNIKLVILTITIIVFVTGTISFLIYKRTSNMIHESYTEEIDNKIEIINGEINALLQSTERLADNLIALNVLKNGTDKNVEKLIRQNLEAFQKNYPETLNISFYRDDQQFIYPRDPDLEDFRPDETEGYNAKKNGEVKTWSTPYIDYTTSEWAMDFSKLVYENEKVIGYVQVTISLSHLQEVVGAHKINDVGSMYILNSDGVILISPFEGLVNVDIPDQKLKEYVMANEKGSLTFESSTDTKVVKFTNHDDSMGWKIMGVLPQSVIDAEVRALLFTILFYAVIIGAIGSVVMIFVTNRMINKIRELTTAINYLGDGELNTLLKIHSNDEIGQMSHAYNEAVGKIRNLISSSQDACNSLLEETNEMTGIAAEATSSTNYITECIQNIANDSVSQAEETKTLNKNFNELSQAMERVSDSIQEIHEIVQTTQKVSHEGIDVVTNLLSVSSSMTASTNKVKDTIDSMELTTKDIYSIVQTINDISEQTNLLALNASIEAARAGESGKGFAVVADEVRKLAESTASSVGEIKELIQRIQGQANNAVNEIVDVTDNTCKQTNAVEETKESFKSLGSSIENISISVQHIDELNNNMMDVKVFMENVLSNITDKIQNNADNTNDITSMTEEQLASMVNLEESLSSLTEAVQRIEQEIHVFKVEVEQ